MTSDQTHWLLESGEPWTRYRTLVDLLGRPGDDPDVKRARAEMLLHPGVQGLIADVSAWGEHPLKRHNDASHPIYKFSVLADFGLRADDPGMAPGIQAVMAHQAVDGAYQTVVNIPKAFGGTDEDLWTWMACDAPTLLYVLLSMGLSDDERVQRAAEHLVSLVEENGYQCKANPALGKFRGPGRKADPCPIANVLALKALAQLPALHNSPAVQAASEVLLGHWELRNEKKYYLFGIGTDFRKLKYPFVWYDILHVVEVLSRFPCVHEDPRFQEMVTVLSAQVGEAGRYTPTSMYRAWKGWPFADKKNPSAWLTFLVLRVEKRAGHHR